MPLNLIHTQYRPLYAVASNMCNSMAALLPSVFHLPQSFIRLGLPLHLYFSLIAECMHVRLVCRLACSPRSLLRSLCWSLFVYYACLFICGVNMCVVPPFKFAFACLCVCAAHPMCLCVPSIHLIVCIVCLYIPSICLSVCFVCLHAGSGWHNIHYICRCGCYVDRQECLVQLGGRCVCARAECLCPRVNSTRFRLTSVCLFVHFVLIYDLSICLYLCSARIYVCLPPLSRGWRISCSSLTLYAYMFISGTNGPTMPISPLAPHSLARALHADMFTLCAYVFNSRALVVTPYTYALSLIALLGG